MRLFVILTLVMVGCGQPAASPVANAPVADPPAAETPPAASESNAVYIEPLGETSIRSSGWPLRATTRHLSIVVYPPVITKVNLQRWGKDSKRWISGADTPEASHPMLVFPYTITNTSKGTPLPIDGDVTFVMIAVDSRDTSRYLGPIDMGPKGDPNPRLLRGVPDGDRGIVSGVPIPLEPGGKINGLSVFELPNVRRLTDDPSRMAIVLDVTCGATGAKIEFGASVPPGLTIPAEVEQRPGG